jgi:hypothetical protein
MYLLRAAPSSEEKQGGRSKVDEEWCLRNNSRLQCSDFELPALFIKLE